AASQTPKHSSPNCDKAILSYKSVQKRCRRDTLPLNLPNGRRNLILECSTCGNTQPTTSVTTTWERSRSSCPTGPACARPKESLKPNWRRQKQNRRPG